ncbi:MAG: histidine kinase [Flaviaesturariibacter sp.]|nr:histidine kinase [Flaviaesturariibacter sp.]
MTTRSIDKERVRFYGWAWLAFSALWVVYSVITDRPNSGVRTLNYLWAGIYVLALNIVLFEWVLPLVRRKRASFLSNILLGIVLFWAVLMLGSFGLYLWRFIGIRLHIYTSLRDFKSITAGVGYHFPYTVSSFFFFGIVRHAYAYTRLKHMTQQLRIEKQEAELNYLRSQTNPHFLFNTLNNIYSLARDKSDRAPESILRLSKMLRFMLYEAGGDYIAVGQELRIIDDYIALEQLRYDESLRINLTTDIEDPKQALPPLLLIPLVENAFKHGVSETRGNAFVDIHLSIRNSRLRFLVRNSAESPEADGRQPKENIGLSNLRRQLALLYRESDLHVAQADSVFTTTLTINLASHV